MAIWRITAKRDQANGKIKAGQSVTVTTIGSSAKPQSHHLQKAYDTGSISPTYSDANFISEMIG